MTILEILHSLGIPANYMKFDRRVNPPYAVYYGAGQDQWVADNGQFTKRNTYTIEYYFNEKDSTKESDLEDAFTAQGFRYEKSEDVYIQDEKMDVIYYTVWRN